MIVTGVTFYSVCLLAQLTGKYHDQTIYFPINIRDNNEVYVSPGEKFGIV